MGRVEGQVRIAAIVTDCAGVRPGCEPTLSCLALCVLGVIGWIGLERSNVGNFISTIRRTSDIFVELQRYCCGDSVRGPNRRALRRVNGNRTYVVRFECQ